MHVILLNAVRGGAGAPQKIHELRFDARAQDDSPNNAIDLLVVDARDMDTAALNAAIVWVARMRNTQPVRKAVMICAKPPIEFVVRAIRAGVNDIFERPLSGRQLYLLFARNQTDAAARRAARSIMAWGRLLETTEAAREPTNSVNILERERKVDDIRKQFAAESARLEQLRDTLHAREADLRERAQRLDEEFARMQTDADLVSPQNASVAAPATLPPDESERSRQWEERERALTTRVEELEAREVALATRDRMLREFEAMLLSQAQAATAT